jgi:hypothetical protein
MYTFAITLSSCIATVIGVTTYTLTSNSSGIGFFNDWEFASGTDGTTTGNVLSLLWPQLSDCWYPVWFRYQSRSAAFSENLAYINSVGNAVIKVDNKTVGLSKFSFLVDYKHSENYFYQ